MELKCKIWLAEDPRAGGTGFLGEGRFRLLKAIDRAGSLRKAAEQLGISYRKAWGDIRSAESHLGFPLLERHRGGRSGGASALTEQAKQLLQAYDKVTAHIQARLAREFDRHISPLVNRD